MKKRANLSRGRRVTNSPDRKLRIGVAGLGRAFSAMLPTFTADPRVALVAAADPRAQARERFAAEFAAKAYAGVEDLCADPAVEVVYVATPHQFHAAHGVLAAAHGKHLLIEKPLALTLEDCDAVIAAANRAGVRAVDRGALALAVRPDGAALVGPLVPVEAEPERAHRDL